MRISLVLAALSTFGLLAGCTDTPSPLPPPGVAVPTPSFYTTTPGPNGSRLPDPSPASR